LIVLAIFLAISMAALRSFRFFVAGVASSPLAPAFRFFPLTNAGISSTSASIYEVMTSRKYL
jgi:hypothetical protein